MSIYDLYSKMAVIQGNTERERLINKTKDIYQRRAESNPSFKSVSIDGVPQQVFLLTTEDAIKYKISSVQDCFNIGSLIIWNDTHWLVTKKSIDEDLFITGEVVQCNRQISWQNPKTLEVITRWAIFESGQGSTNSDGTILSIAERVFQVRLPFDEETCLLDDDKRFLLEKIDGKPKSYKVIKVNQITSYFADTQKGILNITLKQDQYDKDNDNAELMIANYKRPPTPVESSLYSIEYSDDNSVKIGGTYKQFTAVAKDELGNIIPDFKPLWRLITLPEFADQFDVIRESNYIKIQAQNNLKMIGTQFSLELYDENNVFRVSLLVNVKGMI